jgi:uncharacterized protein (UPF0218 family)
MSKKSHRMSYPTELYEKFERIRNDVCVGDIFHITLGDKTTKIKAEVNRIYMQSVFNEKTDDFDETQKEKISFLNLISINVSPDVSPELTEVLNNNKQLRFKRESWDIVLVRGGHLLFLHDFEYEPIMNSGDNYILK